jgi:hypothetical protein
MNTERSLVARLRGLLHRNRLREELDEEVRTHLEMEAEYHRVRGLPPEEARRAALLAFGGVERFREETRAARGGVIIDGLARDIRIALRGFRRAPTFAITAVLILGVAIGMTTAMITVFDAVLVQRLPVREQDRLVELWPFRDRGSELSVDITVTDAINRQSTTIREAASIAHYGSFAWPLSDGDRAVVMAQSLVSGNFFDVLGAKPALGRLMRPEDDIAGAGHAMVISYDAWRHVFNGDTAIVGHHLTYAGTGWTYTIIGVAPPGLDYPSGVGCWTALIPSGYTQVHVIARLASGATSEAARAAFLSVAAVAEIGLCRRGSAHDPADRARQCAPAPHRANSGGCAAIAHRVRKRWESSLAARSGAFARTRSTSRAGRELRGHTAAAAR